jgi:uncharacterized protein (DUF2252 family)
MNHASAVEEIARVNLGRKPKRLRLKYERMSADVFAFFRGTDHLFARAWAKGLRPPDPGPEALICGDLHLENFGAYSAEDGTFLYDINDFDEATVAPVGFDLTRCVTSILLASDVWRLPLVRAERVALAFLDRYREAVAELAEPGAVREMTHETGKGPVHKLLGRAASNTQDKLLARQTRPGKHGSPRIRRKGGLHPAISPRRFEQVAEAVEAYGAGHDKALAYKVLDVSGRIAGIGSLGVKRYLVLIEGDGPPDGYRLLDVKQAGPASLTPFLGANWPPPWTDDAHRVVEAQRALQARPAAGLDTLEIDGEGYRMRTTVPAENRTSLDEFREQTSKLAGAVTLAGRITGWSQARGARFVSEDRISEVLRWSTGPGPDSILATAVRQATQARHDYHAFCQALHRHGIGLLPHPVTPDGKPTGQDASANGAVVAGAT